MALCDCYKQAKWIKTLLAELGINVGPIPIHGDNQGYIFLGSNPVQGNRSKHIDIQYHFVWQCMEDKEAKLYFVKGAENPADTFTKSLGHVKFHKFRGQLGFENKWLLIQLIAIVDQGQHSKGECWMRHDKHSVMSVINTHNRVTHIWKILEGSINSVERPH